MLMPRIKSLAVTVMEVMPHAKVDQRNICTHLHTTEVLLLSSILCLLGTASVPDTAQLQNVPLLLD